MATESASAIVRSIIIAEPNLPTDQVIEKAQARGVKVPPKNIRKLFYNVKGEMKKKAEKAPAPASAARLTPKPQPHVTASAKAASSAPASPAPVPILAAVLSDLPAVLANVALVNKVVGTCGGSENARQVAEAVRACGGLEAFLQHLELVAGIRAGDAAQ